MSTGWAPGVAFMRLVEARERAMPLTDPMTRRHAELTEGEILDRLSSSQDTRERRALGLILARLIGEEAIALESAEKIDDALFRLAHHYRESHADSNQPRKRRRALRAAALSCFAALRNPPRGLIKNLDAGKAKSPNDGDWKEGTGLSASDFEALLESAIGGKRAPTILQEDRPATHPSWLHIPRLEFGSPFITSLANWDMSNVAADVAELADVAGEGWQRFEDGDYEAAYAVVEPIRASLDVSWAPSGEVDALTFWHWLRLLTFLHQRNSGEHGRRAALGAFELLQRIPNDSATLSSSLQDVILEGFRVSDPGSEREWSVVIARFAYLVGHESTMGVFTNEERAFLRRGWHEHLRSVDLNPDDSTHDMVVQIELSLRGIRARSQRLQTDQDVALSRHLGEGIKEMQDFADSYERALLDQVEQVVAEFRELDGREQKEVGVSLLENLEADLDRVSEVIRTSGSLMLQEAFLPAFALLRVGLEQRWNELRAVARPDLRVDLHSRRLPLQADSSYKFEIETSIRNEGDVIARDVKARIDAEGLTFTEGEIFVGDLPPGSEKPATFRVLAGSGGTAVAIDLTLEWMDDLERSFSKSNKEHAEAQRPSQWHDDDANPFQLGSIDDPDRLVGRDNEVQALIDLVRAQGSTYVTGHKRVGKTSLVKVLLKILQGRGFATAMLPLGRALGARGSASDLVMAMLDSLRQSIQRMRPDVELAPIDEAAIESNFGLAAGRWLAGVHDAISEGIRAVIAIDDFDELPLDLVNGQEADALFLFMRTLVDERWLSLVFIGSEVLPTLIRRQGYKLNQVTETRVGRFTSRSNTKDLLEEPTLERLDWDPRAVDGIHSACAGNPYYATLVGQRIWQVMRDQDRTYVLLSDSASVLDSISENAEARHFVHFWADDPKGMDPASDRAQHASAILRAVAKSTAVPGQRVRGSDAITVAKTWVPGARTNELEDQLRTLLSRQVLEPADGESVSIGIPILASWLRRGGGRYLDSDYASSSLAKADQYVVTAGELVSLTKRLFYCGERVNEVQALAWLEQFDEGQDRWLAFQLLNRLVTEGYFGADRLAREAIPALAGAIRQTQAGQHQVLASHRKGERVYLENWYILDREVSGSSADVVARGLSANLKVKKASNVLSAKKLIGAVQRGDHVKVVLIVDDFAGTGHQLEDATDEFIQALEAQITNWREKVVVVVGACVGATENVLDGLQEESIATAVGIVVGNRLRAFDSDAGIFETEEDLRSAKDLFTSIGEGITAGFPLGYGGHSLLVLFEENCPNNTLPPFWAAGEYRGDEWKPLFARRW